MSEPNMNNTTENVNETYDAADIEKNKVISGLAYILFFLPLLACPESKYGRFHTNQALILFLGSIAGSIILSLIPIIGWILLPFFSIAVLVFAVIGLINGLTGKAKELPLIGKFRLLK
jgi:Predicted membrane protein